MNVQDVLLDIDKSPSVGNWVTIGQGDKAGTTIRATVYDHGTEFPMSGMTARFCMRTPSGGYVEDESVNVSGNTLTYVVDEEHCAGSVGTTDECYFQILQGENVIASTSRFSMRVLRAASSGADPAQSYSDDIVAATRAARDAADAATAAMEEIGTAVDDAAQAAESAAQAVEDAQTAVEDADTAKREATSAANAATAAANNANSKANLANTAANNANAATTATNSATQRAEAAIAAMGDISEQAVPLMSPDTRGGAKLGDGLAVDDGTLHVGQLAKASTGEVYGPLASVTAKGHAEQFSTTGKNLAIPYDSAYVSNGVTVTPQADGSVILIGTLNGEFVSLTKSLSVLVAGSTYTASVGDYSGTGIIDYGISGYGKSKTVTPSSTFNGAGAQVYAPSGTVFNNVRLYPQLELGSTATEYEPYTGGAPSPSPDYPQEIQVVRGRNLLDESKSVYGQITSDGTVEIASSGTKVSDYIEVEPNTTYYLTNTLGASSRRSSETYDADKNPIAAHLISGSGLKSGVVTVENNARYIRMVHRSPEDSSYAAPMLTLGSTPQPYVPYGHVGLEVQGKNLLLNTATSQTVNNVTFTVNADGSVHAKGTGGATLNIATNFPLEDGKTYTLHGCPAGGGKSTWRIYGTGDTYRYDNGSGVTWTQSGDTTMTFIIIIYANQTVDFTFYPQLELGSVATPYEPYFEPSTTPIPLPQRGWVGGLPDGTADILSIDSAGKVEWEKQTEEVDLGTLDWLYYTQQERLYANLAEQKLGCEVLCEAYIYTKSPAIPNKRIWNSGFAYLPKNIVVHDADYTDPAVFKTAMSGINLLFELATPVTEQCGYVDLPDISSEATVSIRELEDLGVTFWIDDDGAIRSVAKAFYERAHSEYEDRITALEEAMSEMIAGA